MLSITNLDVYFLIKNSSIKYVDTLLIIAIPSVDY